MVTKSKELPEKGQFPIADMLSERPWSFWSTFTTRKELTIKSARRSMALLGDILSSEGHNDYTIFWAAEPYDVKEGQHLHALVHFASCDFVNDNKPQFTALRKAWTTAIGDINARQYHVRYDPKLGARYYVAKYISKKLADYDWMSAASEHRETLRSSRIVPVTMLANGKVMEVSKYKAIKSKKLRKQIDQVARHDPKIFAKVQEYENSYYEANDTLTNIEQQEHKEKQRQKVNNIVKQNKKGYEKLYSMRQRISRK
jgi:hypothetical protein